MVYTIFSEWNQNGTYEANDVATYDSLEEAKKNWKVFKDSDTQDCTWVLVDEDHNIIIRG